MLRIVQVTDPHLGADADFCLAGVSTRDSFQKTLALAAESSPDLLLVTGDIAADPSTEAYASFFSMIQSFPAPMRWLPGNHDSLDVIQSVARSTSFDRVYDLGNWRLLQLDSVKAGSPAGSLSEAELARFEKLLEENTQEHVLVALHHHALEVGSRWLDQQKIDTAERFLDIVSAHSAIRAVLCGHVHQEYQSVNNGVLFASAPSTCVQFAPNSDDFALDELQPGLRVIDLEESGSVQTHVLRLPDGSFEPDHNTGGY